LPLPSRAGYSQQFLRGKLIDHKARIRGRGDAFREVRN
jgi:hypothetical protein